MNRVIAPLAMSCLVGLLALGCGRRANLPAPAEGKPDADLAAVVEGNNRFAVDLYHQLREQQGNLFVSPYSLSTALAMTSVGARGETAQQMAKTLHFPVAPARLHPAYALLIQRTTGPDNQQGYQLSVGNRLWGQQGYGFRPEFLAEVGKYYGAGFQEVDFAGKPEEARLAINAWGKEQTRGKIPQVLDSLSPQTVLLLANALYFKGNWEYQFPKSQTREKGRFQVSADQEVEAPMMNLGTELPFGEGKGFHVLSLPYAQRHLSMMILLPDEVNGLAELERSLTAARLQEVIDQLRPARVLVGLPKFTIRATYDELAATLSALGMPQAFSGQADFSGTSGAKELFLGRVLQKTYLEVNEEGSEAAAITVVEEKKDEGSSSSPRLQHFYADHPFLFLIRDNRTGSLLFLGRLVDPSRESVKRDKAD